MGIHLAVRPFQLWSRDVVPSDVLQNPKTWIARPTPVGIGRERNIYIYIYFWLGLGASLYLLGFSVEVYRTSDLDAHDEVGDAHSLFVCASLVGIFGLAIGGAACVVVALLALPFPCGEAAWFCGPLDRSWFRTSSQGRTWASGTLTGCSTSVGLRS